jgi:hypothetical protein
MKLSKLRRKTIRQANREHRRGRMTDEEARTVTRMCNDEVAMKEFHRRVENEINPWNNPTKLLGDWKSFWANLKDWFVENWPQILALIMKLAPLLLILEPADEDR